jgi:hypothetical protein
MRLGIVTAIVAFALPAAARDPGQGTRVVGELGAGLYNGTLTSTAGRTSIDGVSARLRVGLGLEAAPGLFLGPAIGLEWNATDSTREVCCGTFDRVRAARFGLEGAYYFDRQIGFRVQAGIGYAFATLAHDGEPGVLRTASPRGVSLTAALARDWSLGERTRIGAVLRVESDVLTGNNYTLRTLTPSLSFVFFNHL